MQQITIDFRSSDALMAFGPELRIDAWNDELEQLTGIPAAEAIGRPCWDSSAGSAREGP